MENKSAEQLIDLWGKYLSRMDDILSDSYNDSKKMRPKTYSEYLDSIRGDILINRPMTKLEWIQWMNI